MNKSALGIQYGCYFRTIDRRLNPSKYKKEYTSILDPYRDIIDTKIEKQL